MAAYPVAKGSAAAVYMKLDGLRAEKLTTAEECAALTIPKLFPLSGETPDTGTNNQDYQSFGAQCVNHLATKLMLTLFSPSRPFIRLDPSDELRAQAQSAGIDETQLTDVLRQGELKAVKTLDGLALRPKLFEIIKHLIVVGDVLEVLDDDENTIRVMTMRSYVVKRDIAGRVHTLCIKECVSFDELELEVQQEIGETNKGRYADDSMVDFYILVQRQPDGKYATSQWVNEHRLGPKFDGKFTEDKLPYRVLTWDLADKDNYGTGLCEDYLGDLSALSLMSESLVNAAILAGEYRWLANPGGMTRPEDFNASKNGECLPGSEGDLTMVNAAAQVAGAMQVQQSVAQDYIGRIGRGFLMSSAVTRNAERVTAEEIRMQAQELETGLGGAYSRLAVDLQKPLALFLLALAGLAIKGKSIVPVIVTGLDALSRNGDLENLKNFLNDLGKLGLLPDPLLRRLKLDAIITDLGTGWGVQAGKYVKSSDEVAQDDAQAGAQEAATAGGVARAEAAAQPQGTV